MGLFDSLCLLGICTLINPENFWNNFADILQKNDQGTLGFSLSLDAKEKIANDYLMKLKIAEIENGRKDLATFAPALHFFQAKDKIETSKVFEILKALPKGSALYSHNIFAVSDEFILNLTYRDNLYGCIMNDHYLFKFSNGSPPTDECNWQLLKDLRQQNLRFDAFLKTQLSLRVDDPYTAYPTIQSVWDKYNAVSITLASLISYKPVLEEYVYQFFKELHEDNIIYVESRISITQAYDLTGKVYNESELTEIVLNVRTKFLSSHPDFFLAKAIFSPIDIIDNLTLSVSIDLYLRVMQSCPDIFAGFELSCIDNSGKPISDFLPQINRLIENCVKLFYHGKEIQWYDNNIDINIVDGVLLNVTRVGNAHAIVKNSVIGKLIKQKNIGVELTPIANQVLKLCDEVKNNPGSILMVHDYPVIITSDDGSFWGTKGLSYDWYVAFMGLAEKYQDLKLLKQLALNSLYHSSLDDVELKLALKIWETKWEEFIAKVCLMANADLD